MQNDRPLSSRPIKMQRVLSGIDADGAGDHCVHLVRHGGMFLVLLSAPSKAVRGRSTASPSHFPNWCVQCGSRGGSSDQCPHPPLAVRAAEYSDRHPVTVEFMIFVISALTSAKVCKIMNELDRGDPFHHLEAELIFAAQP